MNARPFHFFLRGLFGFAFFILLHGFDLHAAVFDVGSIRGLTLWLKADSGVVTNENGFVNRWEDQSGNGHHAIQTNSISMPKWVNAWDMTQPTLHFNGVTNFLEISHSAGLSATNDLSIFAVVRVEDFSRCNGIISKAQGRRAAPFDFYIHPTSGLPYFFRGNGDESVYLNGKRVVNPEQMAVVSVVVQETNAALYLDGALNGNGTISIGLKDAGRPVRIGSRDDFDPMLKGDLAEIILIRNSVSDVERTAIHRYLGDKYRIPVVLEMVALPPTIQRAEGQSATFAASQLNSYPIVHYQWQRNGVDISDATNASYTTPELTLADNNSTYRVRISSHGVIQLSNPTVLTVVPDTEPLTISASAFLLQGRSFHESRESQSEEAYAVSDETKESVTPVAASERVMLSSYSSRLWQPGEDPLRNTVQAIAQTPDGFLWVGTQDGLARFNGVEFEFVSVGSNSDSGLRVNALATGADGSLWVGSTQGLFQFKNGQWLSQAMPSGVDSVILSLCQNRDGCLWIGTRGELVLYQNEKFSLLDDQGARSTRAPEKPKPVSIRSIATDINEKNVWTAASEKLVLWKNSQVITNLDLRAFRPDFIRVVCHSRDGSLWTGSNAGLTRHKDGEFTHFSKANGLPDNVVTGIYEDRRGNLWIGTYGGLCRLVNGKFVVETASEGELYNLVSCFFEDRENNLWVGSKDGLHQLNAQQFTTYTTRHGLAHNNVISVYEDDEETLWIGTWGGGLHQLRRGKITIYSSAKTKVMRNDLILALQGSHEGGLWFSEDYDAGLYRLRNEKFQRLDVGRNAIRSLLEDTDGRLWLGRASAYVGFIEHGKLTQYNESHGLPTNATRCLLQTQDGRIWAGTEAGLCGWTNGGFFTLTTKDGLSDNAVFSLYEDKERNLWIGTGKGLCRMKESTRHVSQFTFTDAILEIVEDDFEHLWLATRRGIFRVSKKELHDFEAGKISQLSPMLFGKADGMASQICVGVAKPSSCKTRDGRLWFATTKGLAVTDPKLQITKNEKPPPVVIRSLLVDKKTLSLNSSESENVEKRESERAHFPTLPPSPLLLPPGRGDLEFRYAALSYTAPEKNRFKYKLEGLDNDWVDADTRREAYYNKVPPGEYTFHVIACNNDGVWNEMGTKVGFTLQPHFWQTWWWKSFIALASLSFVAMTVRYATKKRMQFKLERLEQQHAVEKERTRIAQDMHDDLGARLTEIVMLSNFAAHSPEQETKTHVAKVARTAHGLVRSLDALVWAVDPGNDSLENLVFYLQEYVEMFLGMTSIRYRVDIPTELPDCPISSEVRHNIFLVVKESLNNVVKHSGASEVWFRLKFESGTLRISIEDNGKGFHPDATTSDFGNGLGNMAKRLGNLGGRCEIASKPGEGTSVRLQIPIRIDEIGSDDRSEIGCRKNPKP